MISYIPKNALIVAKGFIQEIQTITTTAPATIPLIAPARVKSFQYKEQSTKGLNAAPKPAQALPTKFSIVSFGCQAIVIATIATSKTDKRPIKTNSFWCDDALSEPLISLQKSSVKELDVTSNCEEIVLIIAARMAANKNPPTSG